MSLDKLRKLDAAASPGPWTANDSNENGDRYVGPDPAYCLIVMSPEHLMLGAKGDTEATAQYTALARTLFLPAMEALEEMTEIVDRHTMACGLATNENEEVAKRAHAALAQLEEALK